MTEDARMLCRRCGYANLAGDQFCGSCGAFLEWEGQADGAAGTPPAGTPAAGPAGAAGAAAQPHGASQDLAGLVRPAVVPTPPVVPAGPGPTPAAPPPAVDGVVRCPACGIANTAGRTFCQSCGATLATASRVPTRTTESIAAAVAAVPRATPVTPASASAGGRAASDSAPRKGGLPGWLIAVVVLGIVAGVGIVVVPSLLKGSGPASAATAEPSLGPSAAAASGQAPASTTPSGQPSPTSAVAGKPLKLTGAGASSVVGGLAKFQPQMAIDGDPKTSWQEGSPIEKGQWIEVSFAASRVDAVVIRNGYGASTALYKGNLRLRDVLISVNGGTPLAVRLKDTSSAQRIPLGGVSGGTTVRITIVTTYASVKTSVGGTPFDDAAVSEIQVIGVVGR